MLDTRPPSESLMRQDPLQKKLGEAYPGAGIEIYTIYNKSFFGRFGDMAGPEFADYLLAPTTVRILGDYNRRLNFEGVSPEYSHWMRAQLITMLGAIGYLGGDSRMAAAADVASSKTIGMPEMWAIVRSESPTIHPVEHLGDIAMKISHLTGSPNSSLWTDVFDKIVEAMKAASDQGKLDVVLRINSVLDNTLLAVTDPNMTYNEKTVTLKSMANDIHDVVSDLGLLQRR